MNEMRKLIEAIARIDEFDTSMEADLKLRRGNKTILEVVGSDYRRGLIVEALRDGGYNIEYWYEKPSNIMPSEVKVDGASIKNDAKLVYLGFHPEKGDTYED